MTRREFLYCRLKEYAERSPYIKHADIEDRYYIDDYGKEIYITITERLIKEFAVDEIEQSRKEVADLEFTIRKMMKVGNL